MPISSYMNRTIIIMMLILISALIIDTVTSNIYDLIDKELTSSWGTVFFISVSATILIVGLILLLGVMKQQSEHLRKTNLAFNKLYKIILVTQFLIIAFFLFLIIQMVSTSQYFVVWLLIPLVVTAIPAYILLGLLAQRFFSWYRSSKRNMIVLLYGLAIAFMLIGNMTLDIGVDNILLDTPIVKKSSGLRFQDDLSSNSSYRSITAINGIFLKLATVLLTISYIFLWFASAILLHGYSRRLGKSTTYWAVIFLSPIFFLIGILPTLLGIPTANYALFEQNLILFRILTTLASIAGGLLFGISFLALARSMRQIRKSIVADNLKIAGYGIALLPLSIMAGIVFNPYPPVGIASCASLAFASYVFYVGIYPSAISISEDTELRKSIRRTAANELKLLDSIGTAQMSTQVQDKVTKLVKEYSDKMISEGYHWIFQKRTPNNTWMK